MPMYSIETVQKTHSDNVMKSLRIWNMIKSVDKSDIERIENEDGI